MQKLTEVEEARSRIRNSCVRLNPLSLHLDKSNNHVLAEDIYAIESMPPFDRSAVDGYAVNGSGNPFCIKGVIQTGQDSNIVVQKNEAYRIYTGGKVPAGTENVYMQEVCEVDGDVLQVIDRVGPNFIRRKGLDMEKGDLLLRAGVLLNAGSLSLLASNGSVRPKVFPLPKVMHVTTGDEIIAPDQTPELGQIRDSNSILIKTLLEKEGVPLVKQDHIQDDLETAKNAVKEFLSSDCRIFLVSGGASVGDYDFGQEALESQGFEILLSKLNSRPGKPMIFAVRGEQVAFVLPGNPLSHFVVFHLFVKEALCSMAGRNAELVRAKASLDSDFPYKPNARTTFCPAHCYWQSGQLMVKALPWNNSGDLRCLQNTNALLQRKNDEGSLKAGQQAEIIILS